MEALPPCRRGAPYTPRTSPYSFQGLGKRGLENADPALQMDKLPGRIGKVGTMTLNI